MTLPKFVDHKTAREAGWFSRRHQSGEPHRLARQKHRDEHSAEARRERAYARGAERPKERDDG